MTVERQKKTRADKRGRKLPLVIGAAALLGTAILVFFLWPGDSGNVRHAYALAPESALPEYFRKAPPNVREAYRFAIANRGILQQIPCYCGCGSDGHKNNADCYIKNVKPDGTVDFDKMSFG